MQVAHRPQEGCEPGAGCFHCPFRDCRYSGNRSKSEADLFTGRHNETEPHSYMTTQHQRNHTRNHR